MRFFLAISFGGSQVLDRVVSKRVVLVDIPFGWSRMSGRRTSGTSRLSLGGQVLAVFFFIFEGKSQFKKCLGKRLEVPDILLLDICGLLTLDPPKSGTRVQKTERRYLYTEQMDTEGLGGKLLLTPSSDPRRAPESRPWVL